MAKLALKRCRAFQTINITIRVFLKFFSAIGTMAKVYFLPCPIQCGGPLQWLLTQAGWAYDHVFRFPKVLDGISDEQIDARLTTEAVFSAFMAVKGRLIFADPQPYQGTATGMANKCFHFLISLDDGCSSLKCLSRNLSNLL